MWHKWRTKVTQFNTAKYKDKAKQIAALLIARMDVYTRYLTQREYQASNPVLATVRTPLVVGLWVLLGLGVTMLVWGAWVPIHSAAVAKGNVTLLSNKKTIQHLEGGIIEKIYVKDGDWVKAGQKLVRLNKTAADASKDILQGQLMVAYATEARLIASRDGLNEVAYRPDTVAQAHKNPEVAKALQAQSRLFSSQEEAQRAKINVLKQRIAQSKEQIEGLHSQIAGTNEQIMLLDQEIASVKELLASGHATMPRLMELRRNSEELRGNKGQYLAEIAKIQQGITESEMEILNKESEYAAQNSQELRDVQVQITDLEEKLRAAKDVLQRTDIVAPVAGIVNGLKYHTIGGVIEPGAVIMDVIPQDDQLVFEAHIKPEDIDVVRPGLDAKIVLSAYKARTTPKISARITHVSADKFTENQGLQTASYYVAQVVADKELLQRANQKIELYPGMPVDVLIHTGSRSFMSYLFRPITDSMHRAFREE